MITTYNQSASALGTYRKDIPFLDNIDDFSYENFLRMYITKDNQFYYNLLSAKIDFDGDFDASTYYKINVTRRVPWTTISYNEYRNINLWWLIMIVNKVRNPVEYPVPGTELKIFYPEFVRQTVDIILQRIK